MLRKFVPVLAGVAMVMALAIAPAAAQDMTKINFQLKWVTQSQFAGYYAALGEGYYKDMGLDVTLLQGGPDVSPQQVVASGGAEMGTDWIGSLLSARENGGDVVHIAQVFQRSGMREVTWKDSGITSFKIEDRELLESVLATLAAKSNMALRGDIYVKKKPDDTNKSPN